MNSTTLETGHGCNAPLVGSLAWWAARDDMGGFKTAAAELFPGWYARPGCCTAPHRQDGLPRFSVSCNLANLWFFKDWKTGEIGGLMNFVMLAGLDADEAAQWLIERSENDEIRNPKPESMTKPE